MRKIKSRYHTDEFEREDTVRHGPFDIILLCSCVVITHQQIYLPHKNTQKTPSSSVEIDFTVLISVVKATQKIYMLTFIIKLLCSLHILLGCSDLIKTQWAHIFKSLPQQTYTFQKCDYQTFQLMLFPLGSIRPQQQKKTWYKNTQLQKPKKQTDKNTPVRKSQHVNLIMFCTGGSV